MYVSQHHHIPDPWILTLPSRGAVVVLRSLPRHCHDTRPEAAGSFIARTQVLVPGGGQREHANGSGTEPTPPRDSESLASGDPAHQPGMKRQFDSSEIDPVPQKRSRLTSPEVLVGTYAPQYGYGYTQYVNVSGIEAVDAKRRQDSPTPEIILYRRYLLRSTQPLLRSMTVTRNQRIRPS